MSARPALTVWVATLPWTALFVYFGSGMVGVVAHWFKKASAGEVSPSFFSYFFGEYRLRTASVVIGFAGTAASFVFTELLPTMTWGAIMVQGFTAGVSFNALLNKGDAPPRP